MNNLTTLIKRLEAATSLLEDIAQSASSLEGQAGGQQGPNASITGVDGNVGGGQSRSAPDLPGMSHDTSQTAAAQQLPARIQAMDELLQDELQTFVQCASSMEPVVQEAASHMAKAFADQRRFLLVTTKAKKPDMQTSAFQDLLKDLMHDMRSVEEVKNGYGGGHLKDHLSMLGEGVSVLQWLVMEGKFAADFVGDTIGGTHMFGNRILKHYKEGDQSHVTFVRSFYRLLQSLLSYIKKHYPTGVTWNNNGIDAAQAYREAASDSTTASQASGPVPNGTSSSAAAPAGEPASLPPPPPPLPVFDNPAGGPPPPPPPVASPKGASSGGDMGAVFEQLNRGSDVTKGLKKVDNSQMTHKNPTLRAQQPNSKSKSPGPDVKPKPASMLQNSTSSTGPRAATPQPKKAGRTELDVNKWYIENWDSPQRPIELDVELNHSILISRCKNTTVVLKGKANAISIDSSPRLQILVQSLVSSVDVIKSPNFALQVTGALPTVMLDQVDGASIYLGNQSLRTEVYTSKSSSVNIVLPPEKEEDDSKECPLPEQIVTRVKDGRLVSEIVEHAG